MKRLFTLLLIAFSVLSCEMVDEKLDNLLDKRDWVVFADGTELTVDVPSKQTVLNYKFESALDWELTTESEWLEIDPTSGKAGKDIKIQIKVAKNKDKEGRTGYVDLTLSNEESYRITINQAGEGDENEDIVVDIPNNQIWYTSTDGEIVKPYSGEYNNNADALTTFGVNIVSNIYKDGKGVIEFDGDVTKIGEWAFWACSSLVSVMIPDSVTTIGECAFYECTSLTSVTIGDSVTTIGGSAFCECTSLTSVTIPDSVTTIENKAFAYCSSLTSVYCKPTTPPAGGSDMFYDNDSCRKIYVPMESVEAYKSASGWSEYADAIVGYDFDRNEEVVQPEQPEEIPANQIWYTSVDGEIVEPYSGEYNNNADASTTFGVKIVSNTYVDGKGVIEFDGDITEIGLGAFYDCNGLTSVILPNSVIVIKKGAFYGCINLNSVNIPDGVQEIGFDAFCGCTAIRTVTIPESVSFIDDGAFVVCNGMERFNGKFASEDGRCLIIDGVLKAFAPAGLTEYTIPDNVTKIGHAVFLLYSNLENIIIPDSVTEIDNWAFQGCTSLASVTIGDSVTEIGYYAFCDCSNLTSVTIPDSVTTIGNNAFYSCSSLTSVTIPNSVTTIEEGLFRFCSSLASVTIPDSVTTIGSFAFDDCNSLTSVTIPGSVTTIGYNAFSNCSSLTSVTIGNSVTEIGYNAFYDCINLTSITIPDSVTTIGSSAFQDCTSLASVTIGNSVTDIGGGAFYNCTSLTSVTIPDSVTEIGDYAFYGCDSLTSVTIGDSVTTIGYATFAFCENLNTVYCKAINPPTTIVYNNGYWYGFAMQDESGNLYDIDCTIYVYAECVEAYKNAEGWSEYADRIVAEGSIPEDTQTSIIRYTTIDGEPITPRMAVKSNTYINGEGILEFYGDIIGDSAFYGCDSLTSITIGDSVTTIGYNAFSNCSSLTSVTIPDSVTTVGGYAFSGCGNLSAVYITDLVAWCNIDFVNPINNGMQLEANPLLYAQNLYLNGELITELVIPESVTDIKFLAFTGCSASNIVFHDNVKSIGACAFEHCQNLENVVIGNSVESIGNVAFGRCPNLTSVTMSDSLTSFGFNVFLYSSNLREFKGKLATEDGRALIKDNILFTYANASGSEYTIPDGITIIGDGAFFSSVGLKSITIPKSVTTIGYFAFGTDTDIESIYCKATTPPSTGGNIYQSNSCNIYVPFESYQDYVTARGWSQYAASILPYDYENNCVIEANASEETKRWLGKWSSTVSRTYCPQTGFNEETVTFEVNIEHNAVAPNFVKVYGLSVIDPTIAVDGIVSANGDLEILNFNYIGNSGEWGLYVWALSEAGGLTYDRHAVYTMSMDESGNVSCEVGSLEGSPYILFDIFGYNVNTGGVSWYNTNISYYSGPMSWVKIADNGATPSRYSQKVPYITNFRPQTDARLRVVE